MLTNSLQAQTDFNLSDYKNPDYNWRSLDFRFGLNGNNSFQKNAFQNNDVNKDYQNTFYSNLNTRYFSVRNSQYYQGSQTYWLNFAANSYHGKSVSDNSFTTESSKKYNSQHLALGANSINRYYNDKKRFFEVDLNLTGDLGNSVTKNEADQEAYPYTYKNRRNNYQVSASLPLLVGTGRIEEVQDARLAVYILDDLQKAGDLTKTPDKEDILAFASFITETKNQRYFDSRIRKIADITAIDSFLIVNGLKGQSDASYYTLINDNWDYAAGPSRSSGRRFSIGLVPGLGSTFDELKWYNRDTLNASVFETTNKNNNQEIFWNVDAVAYYVCEKPLNLYWQQSTQVNVGYSLYKSNLHTKDYVDNVLGFERDVVTNSPNLGLNMSYALGYFPNSRTNISMTAGAGIRQYWEDTKVDDDPKVDINQTNVNGSLILTCYYYFSPQLRLSVNVSEEYYYSLNKYKEAAISNSDVENTKNFASRITASFTYSIF
ncbi:MAG: hypothetical protein CVT99_04380 [Bacteroidetes bacterium HGW-Bacteroidetes-16]|jgi:hypothetical protein|nr:MAG: hypothetical protein CVT99_04380 [Bacteroidetes bacterium HGW-Bacteroidetes-16]